MFMKGLLGDKRILITGATGGLGQAVVRAFLREGASVAGVARRWPDNAKDPSTWGGSGAYLWVVTMPVF